MNIIAHTLVGVVGLILTKEPLFLIGSILPDIALIPNEVMKDKFDKWNVRYKSWYDFMHSLYLLPLLYFLNIWLLIAYSIHILMDIPFHTSSFRWKPFMIERYKTKKKALLLSGGADSILCGMLEKDYDCFFFDYGQTYLQEELKCANEFCHLNNKYLNIIVMIWYNDIKDRNIMMIEELKNRGYDEVIIGTRNLFPIFDKYKDSNWLRLKILQYKLGIYINMPIVGLFKFQIKYKIGNQYKFYSTENL